MAADLEELISHVGDRGAPKGFVRNLRCELVAEAQLWEGSPPFLAMSEGHLASVIPVDIELVPSEAMPTRRAVEATRRWLALAACTALFVLAGVSGISQNSETGNLETLAVPDEAIAGPVAQVAGGVSTNLSAGTYGARAVGMEIEFATPEPISVVRSDDVALQLRAPFINPSHQQTITFVRLSALSEHDADRWIEQLSAQDRVRNIESTSIDGLAATRLDVADLDAPRTPIAFVGAAATEHQRVWIVDDGEIDPLVVVVSNGVGCDYGWLEGCDDGWLAKAQRLLWTVEFS